MWFWSRLSGSCSLRVHFNKKQSVPRKMVVQEEWLFMTKMVVQEEWLFMTNMVVQEEWLFMTDCTKNQGF